MQATNLTEYLDRYGALIAERTKDLLRTAHVPARDKPLALDLKRKPFDAQAHAVTAIVKAWKHNKSVILCAEMGTGKTMMGIAAVHGARKAPTCLVSLLTTSWAKGPGRSRRRYTGRLCVYRQVVRRAPPAPLEAHGPEWVRDRRNMACSPRAGVPLSFKDRYGVLHCPRCYAMS
jgi:hypothetical protein